MCVCVEQSNNAAIVPACSYKLLYRSNTFSVKINQHLFDMTGAEHRISAPYHPQTNGLDERFNQTLVNCLTKLVGEQQDKWDEYIDVALFAYRYNYYKSSVSVI